MSCGAEAWTLTKKEEQALLIFERKLFRRIYGPKYENGEWKSRMNRELEEMSKLENIVKLIKGKKDKLVRSPGENGGRIGRPKRSSLKNWKDEKKRKTQEKTGKGNRKRFSSAGSEKMERVGSR